MSASGSRDRCEDSRCHFWVIVDYISRGLFSLRPCDVGQHEKAMLKIIPGRCCRVITRDAAYHDMALVPATSKRCSILRPGGG